MFSAPEMASSSWAVQHQTAQPEFKQRCLMLQLLHSLLHQQMRCRLAPPDGLGQLCCHNAAAELPVQQPASWQVMLKVEQLPWCQPQACECMPNFL